MFTIIFIDKHTDKVFSRYRYLFRPFELNGDIAFCEWNELETTANTAVPHLRNLVRGKREWRAIILNTDAVAVANDPEFRRAFVPDRQNPFDFTYADPEPGPHESPVPMIRLSHILGGYASEPKREFVEVTQADGEKKTFVPREHCALELQKHEELSRKYQLDFARPAEIALIALRSTDMSDERRKLKDAWCAPLETASSTFWETNRYPGSCRFLCSDICLNDAAVKDRDLTLFWYSVLTFAINKIPSASLQPYKLYKLGISLSRDHLQRILNEHIDLLKQAQDYVHDELNKAPESIHKTFGDPMDHIKENIRIEVRPEDDINYFEELSHENKDGQKVKDRINREKTVQAEKAEVIAQKGESIKDPRRGIERAAALLRQKVDYYSRQDHECDLIFDQIQLENLKKSMNDLEKSVLTERPANLFDQKKARAAAQKTAERAKRQHDSVNPRWAFGICSIAILTSFASYLWDAVRIDFKTFILSLLTVIAVELVIYYVSKHSYRSQTIRSREAAKRALEAPNRAIEKDIKTTKDKFEHYFSNVCSLMKYHSIAEKLNKYEDETGRRYSMLEAHRDAIKDAINDDNTWLSDFEMERKENPDLEPHRFADLFDIPPESHALYSWTQSDESHEIPLNNTGDQVRRPYAFVEKLVIEREEVFDHSPARSES